MILVSLRLQVGGGLRLGARGEQAIESDMLESARCNEGLRREGWRHVASLCRLHGQVEWEGRHGRRAH